MKPESKIPPGLDGFGALARLTGKRRRAGISLLGEEQTVSLYHAWERWAHPGQLPPPRLPDGTDWSTWVIKAGRGFGKTLAGAQWIAGLIAAQPHTPLRFALVGATIDDARAVMVEGRSGLLEVAGHWIADWMPSMRRLTFTSGAEAVLFSGNSPAMLRGPEHHYAWCDELAKWEKAQESWDMLQLGLRLGAHPQALVTTTPRSGSVLGAIMEEPGTVVTGGSTLANPHLPKAFRERVTRLYAGTRLGRQEIDGEQLPDAAGALWTVELLERCRLPFETAPQPAALRQFILSAAASGSEGASVPPQDERIFSHPAHPEEGLQGPSRRTAHPEEGPQGLSRRIIAVDPPSGDGTCGIIACARSGTGPEAIAHILADHSVTARSPEGWAAAVAAAAQAHGTSEVIAEANQGGKMVQSVLHTADSTLRVKLVHAQAGKSLRAEPVAHLFEAGRAVLHGHMPELEAQLLGMIAGGGYEGPRANGRNSPDRADAMVWGVTELVLKRGKVPGVWRL